MTFFSFLQITCEVSPTSRVQILLPNNSGPATKNCSSNHKIKEILRNYETLVTSLEDVEARPSFGCILQRAGINLDMQGLRFACEPAINLPNSTYGEVEDSYYR